MDGSIQLTAQERKTLLQTYRAGSSARAARRAHVVLLRADGRTWQQIRELLYCSNDLIAEVVRRWNEGRVGAVVGELASAVPLPLWMKVIARWVSERTPQDFGFFRSRWSCEILAEILAWEQGVHVSAETIRRRLHQLGFAWRRPRPVVGPTDPEYAQKLRRIRRLLATLPADEVALFQDEVDVHLNPKIGSMWMRKGEQAEVKTPGNNQKCHISGSLVWTTGTLLVSAPEKSRNAAMFLLHLDDLRRRLRGYRKIHVICDNAKFHDCRAVWDYLQRWGDRVVIHFLPKYAPETNPIERVWWHLHETITRNHRCQTLEELLSQAEEWFAANNNHYLDMRHSFANAA